MALETNPETFTEDIRCERIFNKQNEVYGMHCERHLKDM